MTDYTKQCWSCDKLTMVNKGDYSQCSECGATWNELATPGTFIDIEREPTGDSAFTKYRPVKRRGTTSKRK